MCKEERKRRDKQNTTACRWATGEAAHNQTISCWAVNLASPWAWQAGAHFRQRGEDRPRSNTLLPWWDAHTNHPASQESRSCQEGSLAGVGSPVSNQKLTLQSGSWASVSTGGGLRAHNPFGGIHGKKPGLRRAHALSFHLYEIQKQAQLIGRS